MGPSTRPVGQYSQPLPSGFMMNGSVPDSASSPMAPGFAGALGALVTVKSGTSYPCHLPGDGVRPVAGSGALGASGSHQTHRLRSLQGLPDGSADARLYN